MKRIRQALINLDTDLSNVGGILVTHEHSDHISGLAMIAKHYKIPIYAPRTVSNHIRRVTAFVDELMCEIPVGEAFSLCGVSVMAFRTPHDTPESVGYRIDGDFSLGYCTDLGCVTDEVRQALLGVQVAVVESNHDVDVLRNGNYPYFLKRRILSDEGHLSNDACAELAALLVQNGTRQLMLAHLSRENNTPEYAEEAVLARLMRDGGVRGRDFELYIAPQNEFCSF